MAETDELAHRIARPIRILGGDGVVDTQMIRHRVTLERRNALLEFGERVDRGGDAIGQRHDEGIAGGREQRRMKLLVGDASLLQAQRVRGHGIESAAHVIEMLLIAALGRERSGCGLDDGAQLEQAVEHFGFRLSGERPGQDVGIEQVPLLERAHARAHARATVHETFRREDTHRFPVRRARDAPLRAGFDLAVEHVAGPVPAGDDEDAEVAGDGAMQAQ